MSLSLSSATEGVAFHKHGPSWLGLVAGRKQWVIVPPADGSAMSGQPLRCSESKGATADLPKGAVVIMQEPGEFVYLPADWAHATCNLSPFTERAIAVSEPTAAVYQPIDNACYSMRVAEAVACDAAAACHSFGFVWTLLVPWGSAGGACGACACARSRRRRRGARAYARRNCRVHRIGTRGILWPHCGWSSTRYCGSMLSRLLAEHTSHSVVRLWTIPLLELRSAALRLCAWQQGCGDAACDQRRQWRARYARFALPRGSSLRRTALHA